jgi:hypothetical protein
MIPFTFKDDPDYLLMEENALASHLNKGLGPKPIIYRLNFREPIKKTCIAPFKSVGSWLLFTEYFEAISKLLLLRSGSESEFSKRNIIILY